MAGRGPASSGTRSRARDQRKLDEAKIAVVDEGWQYGPPLPKLPEDQEWPDQTVDWWETWRRSPQAVRFTKTDWSFLLDTALLHMAYWDGNLSVAGELRLRAAKFGATPEDRARLKIEVTKPGDAKTQRADDRKRQRPPAATRSRRNRVLKAVGDD